MTLRDYQEAQELTTTALAKLLGLSMSQTSELLTRSRGCSLKVAVRIERVTEGAVNCADLLPKKKAEKKAR